MHKAIQPSSHNCPMDISDPDLRSSKMCPVFALVDSSFASGMSARLDVSMFLPFATLTDGPVLVYLTVSAVRCGCIIEVVSGCSCGNDGGTVC